MTELRIDIVKPVDDIASAIKYLRERYPSDGEAEFDDSYDCGWSCILAIRSAGIRREGFGLTKHEAACEAVVCVATELGWRET